MVGTIVTTIGFFILFLYHFTETSIATVLVIVAVGLALMQIGSVNVVLTSTPKQFSGISLGMNLLIYLIGSSVGPMIAGTLMQPDQITTISSNGTLNSYRSQNHTIVILTATIISLASVIFAILLNKNKRYMGRDFKEQTIPT